MNLSTLQFVNVCLCPLNSESLRICGINGQKIHSVCIDAFRSTKDLKNAEPRSTRKSFNGLNLYFVLAIPHRKCHLPLRHNRNSQFIMVINPAQLIRHHMANQAAPSYSLIRKRCACGKVSMARQLRQYGRCVTCIRSAP